MQIQPKHVTDRDLSFVYVRLRLSQGNIASRELCLLILFNLLTEMFIKCSAVKCVAYCDVSLFTIRPCNRIDRLLCDIIVCMLL